jgi:hypothetical protein
MNMKGKDMNYTPSTPEEYSAMLNNTLNSYYIHAMNDPSMTKEDAYKQTAEMAERALNASAEYSAAYNADSNHGADKSISVISSSSSVESVGSNQISDSTHESETSNVSADGVTNSGGYDNGGPDGGNDGGGPDSGDDGGVE